MHTKNSLTSLRFIAAFLVVGFHYFSFTNHLSFLNTIFQRGALGVDFFFILSGFVLGIRYKEEAESNQFDTQKFYWLRFLRIAPAYYLSLLLGLVILYKGFSVSPFLGSTFNRSVFVLSNLTFTQSLVPTMTMIEHWNVPSWSVSIEFFFYLLFPFLSLTVLKWKKNICITIVFYVLCCLVFWINLRLPHTIYFLGHESKIMWINSFLFRLPEFLLGNLLANHFLSSDFKRWKRPGLLVSIGLAISLFILPLPVLWLEGGSPFVMLTFILLIYFVALNDEGAGLLNHPWFVLLGEASYILYICQAPLKVLFQQVFSKILGGAQTVGPTYILYLTFCLLSSSLVIYLYFERPLVSHLKKKILEKSRH